jgi:hypothetical protein
MSTKFQDKKLSKSDNPGDYLKNDGSDLRYLRSKILIGVKLHVVVL